MVLFYYYFPARSVVLSKFSTLVFLFFDNFVTAHYIVASAPLYDVREEPRVEAEVPDAELNAPEEEYYPIWNWANSPARAELLESHGKSPEGRPFDPKKEPRKPNAINIPRLAMDILMRVIRNRALILQHFMSF